MASYFPFFRWRLYAFGLSIAAVGLFSVAAHSESAQAVRVVVSDSVALERASVSYLRSIFGMRVRTWPDGSSIKVYVLRDKHPVHRRFTKTILKTFPYNLRKIWDAKIYSGTGSSPILVESQQEMKAKLTATEHAIGYLSDDFVGAEVKVLELGEL